MRTIAFAFVLVFFGPSIVSAFIEPSSFSLNVAQKENFVDLPLKAHGNDEHQDPEFKKSKKMRMAKIDDSENKFVTGEELRNLRMDLESLRQNIQWAEALTDEIRIESLSKAIKEGESRDPVSKNIEKDKRGSTPSLIFPEKAKLTISVQTIPFYLYFTGLNVSQSTQDP